jgi:hypothetical protein
MQHIQEPARTLPIIADVDVLVAGGGIAGCCAAISAARQGVSVLLVERYGYLGGLTAAWPVPVIFQYGEPGNPIVRGIGEEIHERCRADGVWKPAGKGMDYFVGTIQDGELDPEILKLVLMELCLEAGVQLRLHSTLVSAFNDNDQLHTVVIESKSGREAIRCQQAVDATGDGDLAALAGADCIPFEKGFCSLGANLHGIDKEHVRQLQLYYPDTYNELVERFKQEANGCKQFGFHTEGTGAFPMSGNCLDAADLTRMEVEGSMKLLRSLRWARQHFPGYQNAQLTRIAPQFGVRFGRRLVGISTLTEEECKNHVEYEDVVLRFCHSDNAMGVSYRQLVPQRLDGLIVGSRSFSVDAGTFHNIRLIGTAYGLGHAAGAAAGLCVRHGCRFRDLPYAPLRALLLEQGAILDKQHTPETPPSRRKVPH